MKPTYALFIAASPILNVLPHTTFSAVVGVFYLVVAIAAAFNMVINA